MGVVVWRRCCPAHTGYEVSCRVGGVVEWPCVHCGVVDAVFIVGCVEGFRWTSGGQLIRQ